EVIDVSPSGALQSALSGLKRSPVMWASFDQDSYVTSNWDAFVDLAVFGHVEFKGDVYAVPSTIYVDAFQKVFRAKVDEWNISPEVADFVLGNTTMESAGSPEVIVRWLSKSKIWREVQLKAHELYLFTL